MMIKHTILRSVVFAVILAIAPLSAFGQTVKTGGATPYSWLADGSTTAISIKGAPSQLTDIQVTNTLAAAVYVRLYNTASAPTCTSATGIVARYIIPANATGAGATFDFPVGKAFTVGIGACITTTVADTNNTAVASASVAISVNYR